MNPVSPAFKGAIISSFIDIQDYTDLARAKRCGPIDNIDASFYIFDPADKEIEEDCFNHIRDKGLNPIRIINDEKVLDRDDVVGLAYSAYRLGFIKSLTG